jgi:hypothetical protein
MVFFSFGGFQNPLPQPVVGAAFGLSELLAVPFPLSSPDRPVQGRSVEDFVRSCEPTYHSAPNSPRAPCERGGEAGSAGRRRGPT